MKIKQRTIIQPLIPHFKTIEKEGRLDQANGVRKDKKSAVCFGAHLAYVNSDDPMPHHEDPMSHHKGKNLFAEKLGISTVQLTHMLEVCGAYHDPFGVDEWHHPPSCVLERMARMQVPTHKEIAESYLDTYAKTDLAQTTDDPSLLETLADDDNDEVRYAVVNNKKTKLNTLIAIAEKRNEFDYILRVARINIEHKHSTPEAEVG